VVRTSANHHAVTAFGRGQVALHVSGIPGWWAAHIEDLEDELRKTFEGYGQIERFDVRATKDAVDKVIE
jgi:hypothetical protein